MGIQKSTDFDLVVVGAGIVGLAIANHVQGVMGPEFRIGVLEKEGQVARHQSGNSSGVIHAGIYYKPGTLRAELGADGASRMYQFCKDFDVPYSRCGKVVVATNEDEQMRLEVLYERALVNQVPGVRLIEREELREMEPNVDGTGAIFSPNTGIVRYEEVAQRLAEKLEDEGKASHVVCDFQVDGFNVGNDGVRITSFDHEEVTAKRVITCGGLFSDRLAVMSGGPVEPRIVGIRGSFVKLKEQHQDMIERMVYPVPDPAFPFLGVHITPKMDGSVVIGPNAVLAFAREGYSVGNVELKELVSHLTNVGLWKLTMNNLHYGLDQLMSDLSTRYYLGKVNKYMPGLTMEHVETGGKRIAGVRAQGISSDGKLVEDFVVDKRKDWPIVHIRNAPSPAATACFAIAEYVFDSIRDDFGWDE